jgi:serine/threonine-protein kinase RsbW
VPRDVCDTAALLVSELVTNSVLRTEGPVISCTARVLDRGIRLEVHDEGPVYGGARDGMFLVDRVARAWGMEPNGIGAGRTVWASLPFASGRHGQVA